MTLCRGFLTLILLCATLIFGQQNGRFASLKSQGFTAFDRGQYDQVAGKLEEVWEQDQSDPKVAEFLGMGYLYGERSLTKAKPVMEAAIKLGGQATFLVQHSHEKGAFLTGSTMNNYCTGRLSVVPGKLSYAADSGDHAAVFTADDLKEFKIAGGSPGRVQIKSAGKNYIFRLKTDTRDEVLWLDELVKQNVKK